MNKKPRVVFSYGAGLDSAMIITMWDKDPATRVVDGRPFDLHDDLLVVMAQTGGESQQTKQDNEEHILPIMRKHGIRFVQIARAGLSANEGYTILNDTRSPETMFIQGGYPLYTELIESGVVPQYANGKRICSDRSKGVPIRAYLYDMYKDEPFSYIFGFSNEEDRRINKAIRHETLNKINGKMIFPLKEWGLDRNACAALSEIVFGKVIARSCCSFCPFAETSGGESEMLQRYRIYSEEAATTMLLEHVAIALNPRTSLYPGGKRVLDIVRANNMQQAIHRYETILTESEWALYHVQRVYRKINKRVVTDRNLITLMRGDRAAAIEALHARATIENPVREVHGDVTPRIYLQERIPTYPAIEEMYVIAPAYPKDKQRARFGAVWAQQTMQTTFDDLLN